MNNYNLQGHLEIITEAGNRKLTKSYLSLAINPTQNHLSCPLSTLVLTPLGRTDCIWSSIWTLRLSSKFLTCAHVEMKLLFTSGFNIKENLIVTNRKQNLKKEFQVMKEISR